MHSSLKNKLKSAKASLHYQLAGIKLKQNLKHTFMKKAEVTRKKYVRECDAILHQQVLFAWQEARRQAELSLKIDHDRIRETIESRLSKQYEKKAQDLIELKLREQLTKEKEKLRKEVHDEIKSTLDKSHKALRASQSECVRLRTELKMREQQFEDLKKSINQMNVQQYYNEVFKGEPLEDPMGEIKDQ